MFQTFQNPAYQDIFATLNKGGRDGNRQQPATATIRF